MKSIIILKKKKSILYQCLALRVQRKIWAAADFQNFLTRKINSQSIWVRGPSRELGANPARDRET